MASQLKDLLESGIESVIRGTSRRQGALLKDAKGALALLQDFPEGDGVLEALLEFQLPRRPKATRADSTPGSSSPEKDDEGEPTSSPAEGVKKDKDSDADADAVADASDRSQEGSGGGEVDASKEESEGESFGAGKEAFSSTLRVMCGALKLKQVKVVDPLLDIIYGLVTKGLLGGIMLSLNAASGEEDLEEAKKELGSKKKPFVLSVLLESICSVHDIGDENVEKKLLKLLLALTLSKSVGVHGEALLLVVRTCYHIFLGSRSEVVQLFAKACLIQFLMVLISRIERPLDADGKGYDVEVPCIVISEKGPDAPASPNTKNQSPEEVVQALLEDVCSVSSSKSTSQGSKLCDMVSSSYEDATFFMNGESADQRKRPAEAVGSQELEEQSPATSNKSFTSFAIEEEGDVPNVVLMARKDAFLVFRALCKLSMKTGHDGPSDHFALRGKVLSLELIKILLEKSGRVFQVHEKYIEAIKQYLCYSLLKNCSTAVTPAFQLSASIFETLTNRFRPHLKSQFAVFFPMIFLRPFESQGGLITNVGKAMSTHEVYAQWVVLFRCLYNMCSDKQILSDIFVNYDCDLDESNLFERLVSGLVKLVQGVLSLEGSGFTPTMQFNLKLFALQCLIAILKSLAMEDEQDQEASPRETLDGDDPSTNLNATPEAVGDHNALGEQTHGSNGSLKDLPAPSMSEQLEQRKAYKTEFQKGIIQFKKKPKKGIQYLQKLGMLGESCEDIARFLLSTQGLDKNSIGDYLGEADALNLDVMHSYVEMLDFSGLEFDAGIRHFLRGFRLPGEAQKIDRLMEKFAERYCICNPESFAKADTAYVLAYSVIMLNTDAHNPQVKDKMSLEGFVKNNKGINDGEDLPQEFLAAIYKNIVNNEIKMKGEGGLLSSDAPQKKKQTTGIAGLDAIINVFGGNQSVPVEPDDDAIRQTHNSMKSKGAGKPWSTATGNEDIRPMLEIAWAPILGAISIVFEGSNDESMTSLCIEAFFYTIKIAAPLQMETVRDAFLTSLAKATHLHTPSQMHPKRGAAFKTLLRVALECGSHLSAGWKTVLTSISQFERLHQLKNSSLTDETMFASPNQKGARKGKNSSQNKRNSSGSGKKGGVTDMLDVFDPSCMADIELVFEASGRLSSTSIVEFVQALCQVSSQELENTESPRVYSLTKIVEVAHYNMNRVRIVWSRIWSLLADFFIFVGCHPNLNVAMYAIDALRQLAMKFLERDELANYTFQNDFLRPFVIVMRQSKAVEIRELVIRCVSQFILARVSNVKSGWKSLFMVFTAAASDENKQLVALAFETIEKIVREYFFHVTETETATFTDCVNCLIAFANSPLSDVSLNAIAFLRFSALKLAEGELGELRVPSDKLSDLTIRNETPDSEVPPVEGVTQQAPGKGKSKGKGKRKGKGKNADQSHGGVSSRSGILFTDEDVHLYFWFPLLAGLSELTFDRRQQIRHSSLEVLFDILDYHGGSFAIDFWVRIFNSILFPIFDHVRAEVTETTTFIKASDRPKVDAWLYETSTACLHHVIDLFAKFYPELRSLLPQLLGFISGFAKRSHENLASMGVAALLRMLLSIGDKMDETELDLVFQSIQELLSDAMQFISSSTEGMVQEYTDGKVAAAAGATNGTEPSAANAAVAGGTRARGRSLVEGWGARQLANTKCRISVQILLAQCIGKFYSTFSSHLSKKSKQGMLGMLSFIVEASHSANMNFSQREHLRACQTAAMIEPSLQLLDPPLLELEKQSLQIYLSIGTDILAQGGDSAGAKVNEDVASFCLREIVSFMEIADMTEGGAEECGLRKDMLLQSLEALSALPDPLLRANLLGLRLFSSLTDLIKCHCVFPEALRIISKLFTRIVKFA